MRQKITSDFIAKANAMAEQFEEVAKIKKGRNAFEEAFDEMVSIYSDWLTEEEVTFLLYVGTKYRVTAK